MRKTLFAAILIIPGCPPGATLGEPLPAMERPEVTPPAAPVKKAGRLS